jgi:hypothetical protein
VTNKGKGSGAGARGHVVRVRRQSAAGGRGPAGACPRPAVRPAGRRAAGGLSERARPRRLAAAACVDDTRRVNVP